MNIEKLSWYHIVVCWDSTSGFNLYKDGALVDNQDFRLGAVIKGGGQGILILGQVGAFKTKNIQINLPILV